MNIDSVIWTADGSEDDKTSRLHATISILGCQMHLKAIAVVSDDDYIQSAADVEFDGMVARVYDAVGGDGPWTEVTIDGRQYVLIATPYCN